MDHVRRHVVTPLVLTVLGLSVILGVSYGSNSTCPSALTTPQNSSAPLCTNVLSVPTCPRLPSVFVATSQSLHLWGVSSGCFRSTS
jgi:hypothetical protein